MAPSISCSVVISFSTGLYGFGASTSFLALLNSYVDGETTFDGL